MSKTKVTLDFSNYHNNQFSNCFFLLIPVLSENTIVGDPFGYIGKFYDDCLRHYRKSPHLKRHSINASWGYTGVFKPHTIALTSTMNQITTNTVVATIVKKMKTWCIQKMVHKKGTQFTTLLSRISQFIFC